MSGPTAVFRYLLLVLPAAFLLTAGAQLFSFFHERSDIWWTPLETRVPLAESHNRVVIYVRGAELDDLLAAGQLRLLGDSATSVLTAADIGLRFNNWDRRRAERLPSLLIAGVSAGAAAALLLVGLIRIPVGPRAGGSAPAPP